MSDAAFWRGGEATDGVIADLDGDLDEVFELFSHDRRRALLYLLQESDGEPLWTTNLAVQLARFEAEETDDPHDLAEEIVVSLRHSHLPKLADSGVIDVDSTMTTLTYDGDDRVEDLIQWTRLREDLRIQLSTD